MSSDIKPCRYCEARKRSLRDQGFRPGQFTKCRKCQNEADKRLRELLREDDDGSR